MECIFYFRSTFTRLYEVVYSLMFVNRLLVNGDKSYKTSNFSTDFCFAVWLPLSE